MTAHRLRHSLSRRGFLQLAACLSLSAPVLSCVPSDGTVPGQSPFQVWLSLVSQQNDSAAPTAIVIGAGMAGLAAARQLQQDGLSVRILEARNRIGGRIFTDRSLGIPVDMGASWIHGPEGNPITALAQSAGASTYRTDDDSLVVYDGNGNALSDAVMDAAYDQYLELLEQVGESATPGQSLAQAIAVINPAWLTDPVMVYQLSAYAEFDAGGAIEALNAIEWDEDEAYPGEDILFPSGYDAVVNHLAQGLQIHLEQVVERIRVDATGVEVQTRQGTFVADYCLCTLPIGVLKAGTVTFEPPLPSAFQEAISSLGVGHVNKVAMHFSEPFWDETVQYVGYTAAPLKGQYPYTMNVSRFVPGANMLMTFALGAYGLAMETQSNEQIQEDVLAMLGTIYPDASAPESLLVSRWTQDPYSRGSYSLAGVDTLAAHFEQFEENVAGRLFFAGEHTDVRFRGTVHGAYNSGLRAAAAIQAGSRR